MMSGRQFRARLLSLFGIMFAYLNGPTNPVNRADILRGTEMPNGSPVKLQIELEPPFATDGALLLEAVCTLALHVWEHTASTSVKSGKVEPLQYGLPPRSSSGQKMHNLVEG